MSTFEELNNHLRNIQETIILESDFARLLIIPNGGRVLGVSLGLENLLWVHPNPQQCIRNDDWNLGGIRTWISPERDYFYKNPKEFDQWFCPIGIDPAYFKIVSKDKTSIKMISDIEVKNNTSEEILKGILTKRIELISTNETDNNLSAKIRIHSLLQIHNSHTPVALWSILQVPTNDSKGSKVHLPINVANAIPYFEPIPEEYFVYNEKSIDFILDGAMELKMGIPPEDFPNQTQLEFSYSYNVNGKKASITVNTNTNASNQEECLDVAKYSPNGLKGVIQFYNSDVSKSGLKYGELEIHSKPTKYINGILTTESINTIDFTIEKY
ncbi:MAG: DUF6786 family protein [Candidatus Heimdallarchaeota archaeon]